LLSIPSVSFACQQRRDHKHERIVRSSVAILLTGMST
jgi:hypothetical protein